jgi:hypothetical protein
MLASIDVFLETHELLDIAGDLEADIDLKPAKHDERRLGALMPFERRCYALSQLLEVQLKDMLGEVQVVTMEKATALMRSKKLPLHAALTELSQSGDDQIDDDLMRTLNKLSATMAVTHQLYEFGVRSRYNEFGKTSLIVRTGYVAYTYPMSLTHG